MILQGKTDRTFRQTLADARLDAWLWLQVRRDGAHVSPDEFGDINVRKNLALIVGGGQIQWLVEDMSRQRLLPPERLEWINEDERQVNWLLAYIHNELRTGIYPVPPRLLGKQLIIASIDLHDVDLSVKAGIVDMMKFRWNEHIKSDSIFKWFKIEQEVSRCQFAWDWLIEKRTSATYGQPPISTYAELLLFFDKIRVGDAEKKQDVTEIKRRWSQRKYREKMVGKKQYNLLLSDKTIVDLDNLAVKYGVSRPHIVAALIQCEAEKGIYLPQKVKKIIWP